MPETFIQSQVIAIAIIAFVLGMIAEEPTKTLPTGSTKQ